jgi:hypothetical protein
VDLLSMAIAQFNLQAARSGGVTGKAAEGIQQFKAEMKELRETLGGGLLEGLQKLWGELQSVAGFALAASGGIFKLMQASNALFAGGAQKLGFPETAKLYDERAKKWATEAAAAKGASNELYQKAFANISGEAPGGGKTVAGKPSVSQAEKDYQALLDKLNYQLGAKKRQEEAEKAQKEKERLDGLWLASEGAKLEAADEINDKYFKERKDDQERLHAREMELFDEREKENAEYLAKMPAQMKAVREADIQSQFAELDVAEAAGKAHKDTLTDRIRLSKEILSLQTENLGKIDKLTDPTGWITQQKEIEGTRQKLMELGVELQSATGTMGEGFGKGWTDWINNARSSFDQGKYMAQETAQAMQQTFSNFFFDAWTGKLQSLGDYWRSFSQSILRAWANVISEMIVQWLMKKAAAIATAESIVEGLAAETAAVGKLTAAYYALATAKAAAGILGAIGGLAGAGGGGGAYTFGGGAQPFTVMESLAPTWHGGGVPGADAPAFYRIVPASAFANAERYHAGIGPGEKAAVIRNDEGVFTAGQMRALGNALNRETAAPEVKIDIANIVSPDLLDAYLATGRGQNAILNVLSSRSGTIRRIMRSA